MAEPTRILGVAGGLRLDRPLSRRGL